MASLRGGGNLEKRLTKMAEKLTPATLKVGFLANATYPDGTSVAMVAAIQNFGAPKAHIPPRPFFSNMIEQKSPEWPEAIEKLLRSTKYDVKRTLHLAGEAIRGQLQQAIRDMNDPPLAESTLRGRGVSADTVYDPKNSETFGAKPLIDKGHMINSVDYEVKTT